jgi:hypothetical protein
MSKAAFGKFQSGDLDDPLFDYLKEAGRARAAAIGCEESMMPTGIQEAEWLQQKEHYDVAATYITALMSARGLSASVAGYSISDVASWCKEHWESAPPTCRTTLREHVTFAKKVFKLALHDMGDHCIKVRKLGRLDQPPLQYHIPPSSQVWTLTKGADLGVQEAVRMRTNTPAMANALVWAMHQLQVQNGGGATVGAKPPGDGQPATTMKRKRSELLDLSKVSDDQLTKAQLEKREENRRQRKARKEAKSKDEAKYKQTKLGGPWKDKEPAGRGKGAGGRGAKRGRDKDDDGGDHKRGKGKGGRGGSGAKSPTAKWNNDDKSVTVDGKTYDTVSEDGQRVSQVLGIPEPVCYGWCVKAGACTQPYHADHQGGDEAVAHRNITEEHRELFRQHFARG